MSTQQLHAIEFRCNRCWNQNFAPVELAGQTTLCQVCEAELAVPAATPERIREVEPTSKAVPPPAQVDQLEQLSDSELMKVVKQQNAVAANDMQYSSYPLASIGSRLLAQIIDGLFAITFAVVGGVSVYFAGTVGIVETTADRPLNLEDPTSLIILYFFPLVAAIIQWNLIATRGQTVGKFLMCIRIVGIDGRLPGFVFGVIVRNWVRNLLNLIPFFGIIDALMIFSGSRRCLHDYLAATRVVQA